MDFNHKFKRDPSIEGFLQNTDNEALIAYKKRKKVLQEKNEKIISLESRLNNLEQMMQELLTRTS